MPVTRFFLLLALLYGCPVVTGAQSPHTLAFRHLTAAEGLSHNTVYALLQDKDGLIWIGTRYGLNRYDGYRCDVHLPHEGMVGTLRGFTVLALYQDRRGNLWIGHRGAGISLLDARSGAFRPFPVEPDTALDWNAATIRSIFEDRRGRIWIGTAGNGAVVFDSTGTRVLHLASYRPEGQRLGQDFVFDFAEDRHGNVWIATSGQGVHVYHAASGRVQRYETAQLGSFEKSLCLDAQGRVWVGTAGNGLFGLDPATGHFLHYGAGEGDAAYRLSHDIVTDVAADSIGQLWVATDGGGLNIVQPPGDASGGRSATRVVRASNANGPLALNTDALYQVLFDGAGNLWVGTFNGGVNFCAATATPFTIHRDPLAFPQRGLRSVLALHEGPAGRLWLGTDGGGLFYLDRQATAPDLHAVGLRAGLPPVVTRLAPAGDGALWLGSYAGGLSRYDPRTGVVRTWRHAPGNSASLAHDNVWDVEPDRAGGLWIGTLGGGLDYFAPSTGVFRHFTPVPGNPASLASVQIVDVLLDRSGHSVWAASEDQGLSRVDVATGVVQRYGRGEGLASPNLRCLFQDRAGALWIGTEYSGLDRLDPATGAVTHVDARAGLPSNIVYAIAQDTLGLLWVTTQAGLARIDPRDRTVVDFGGDPNFPQNQFNPNAAIRLADGSLALGGTQGFSILAPQTDQPDRVPPRIVFTGLRLLGQIVPVGRWRRRTVLGGSLNDPGTVVQLSYTDRGIAIEFTGTDYAATAGLRYAYRLDGFDDRWHFVEPGERRVVFSSLKGGTYRLRVKAVNSGGHWSPEGLLRLYVRPPFWQTWWFRLLALAFFTAAAFATVQLLLKRQQKHYEEAALKAEQEILRLKNESLEKEIESNQARLNASVLQNAHKNQFLLALREDLARLDSQRARGEFAESPELRRVLRAINRELDQKDYWDQFLLTFDQTHQHFIDRLRRAHPEITVNDVRLCCFLRLEMTNAEIATILNITVNGVEQTKYRLKKKIGLDAARSLNDYVRQF